MGFEGGIVFWLFVTFVSMDHMRKDEISLIVEYFRLTLPLAGGAKLQRCVPDLIVFENPRYLII